MLERISDTRTEAEKNLINLIKQKSVQERLSKVISLTSLAFQLSKRGIARANPDKDKREMELLFVKLHYGKKLSDKVREYLKQNNL